jgi:MOSC domain-containing protein
LVGEVEELWRYPVKSMLGEKLTTTDVTEKGLLGDRAYALRDTSDGKIATAIECAEMAEPV